MRFWMRFAFLTFALKMLLNAVVFAQGVPAPNCPWCKDLNFGSASAVA